MKSFYESLGILYCETLDRERKATYGSEAILRLVLFENREYVIKQTLTTAWLVRRDGHDKHAAEKWALELSAKSGVDLDWLNAAVVFDVVAGENVFRFKKAENSKPLEAGLVYLIKLQPTGENVAL